MHRCAIPFAFLAAVLVGTCHAKDPRPTGLNCNLSSPPPESGEEAHMGSKLLIFPRASAIDSAYSGCQSLWMPFKGKYELAMLVEVQDGDPVRSWSASPERQRGEGCRYKAGRVVAGPVSECTDPRILILKSVPSGCFPRIARAAAAGEQWPVDCQYD